MIHRHCRDARRITPTMVLSALPIVPIAAFAALSMSTTVSARTPARHAHSRDMSTMVGLGPVRVHQSQILNGTATTDSSGAAAVALTLSPEVAPSVLKGLKNVEGQSIPLRVNGERIAMQTVQTSDDGQTVLLGGFLTQEKAATVALRLSGKAPAPSPDQD